MSVSTEQLVQTYGYELVFYDDRGADKKAFANHECKVIGIGSYLEEKEKKKAIYHELGHRDHTLTQYELNRELCELQADRCMIHHLLKEELSYWDNIEDFNYVHFMEKYELTSIADESMVIEEFYNLVG
ncbi:ImmA/IrrE family metallo-endopeptidase [Streptococcus pyogenes]|uniref:ImmA/IrrE family metallo-endopeptidase n=1 Tax=Streptococcus pyogenes TaxID=1314 RepID=UPI0007C22EDE|nr:ImmA/IrrE family metallo-endopeptidase [Streptococcus pyogenes]QBX18957.1 hypothetical protein Javan457_0042 [Streptococcus phage Javan457]OAC54063.1 hypothetical protein AWT93_05580 [Streptococcus pyogenes]OAC58449.1 hypothetical protein AWU03_08185 [Streptococcus pyogenes]OAC63804.1 hypothetical protein AWU05_03115 [Streptococcus pyogenes]OAC64650.1 hypothetical protein AWU06_02760 [Streptococcus pyogenes]